MNCSNDFNVRTPIDAIIKNKLTTSKTLNWFLSSWYVETINTTLSKAMTLTSLAPQKSWVNI
jgi:hypothetical protein